MTTYRITVRDDRFNGRTNTAEVEADSLTEAIFKVGMEYGSVDLLNADVLTVVKAEVPAGWVEVALP